MQAPPLVAGAPPMYTTAAAPRAPASQAYAAPSPESCEREDFYRKLHAFRDSVGDPIQRLPTLGFKELDLWVLYKEVVKRRGIDVVIAKKQWKEVAEALQLPSSCTDSGFRLRLHYKKYLEAFERKYFDPPESVTPRGSDKDATSATVKAKVDPKNAAAKKAEPKTMEKASSSVTSSGSAATEPGDTGNESAGTVSNGSGSRRSSGGSGGVSRAEATSKGEGLSKGRGIVKKKKRSVGNSVLGLKKQDVKVNKGKDESEEVRRPVSCAKQSSSLGKQTQGDMKMHGKTQQPKRPEKVVEEEKEAQTMRKAAGKGSGGSRSGVKRKAVDEKKGSGGLTHRWSESGSSRDSKPSIAKGICKSRRQRVDFSVLDSATLKRYARMHGVGGGAESGGKKGLAERVAAHFSATPLRGGETATVLRFIQAVRRR